MLSFKLPADDGEVPDDTHDTMGYPPRTMEDEYPEPIKGGVHRDGSGIQHPIVLQVSSSVVGKQVPVCGQLSDLPPQTKPACAAAGSQA